ncbi:hypothetical protein BFW01_g3857 [Lasiodiplodia theobromae]|nr:hypothetical protein BFW01_g3857 [Lasiodiplodia theobromae]
MQSAVLYGLTQTLNNTIQQLPFQCPTGNCTWPAYDSLAICSRCTDLTSSLSQASDYGAQYVPLMEDNNAAAISNGTAYRLPNGLFIDNIDGWAWGAEPMYGAMFMATFGTGNASKTNSMADLDDTLIWAAGVLKTGANPQNASAVWPDLPVAATECALYYCVNRYASSVHNGTLHEDITAVAGAKRAADSWALVDFPEAWEPYNETMAQSIDFDDNFSAAKRSDLAIETPDGQLFNVSQTAVDSISAYFKLTFQEDLMVYNETNNTVDGQINGWYMNSTTIQYKPSAIQPFYTSTDLNTTFKTLATSMTNALRGDADADGSEMVGQTGQMTTYYHVQWPWIALHGVVVLMSALFLILTIRESSGPDGAAPVWKSSTLAAMSRGTHVTHVLDGAVTLGDMQKMAQEEKVVLFAKDGEVMKDGSNVISSGVRSTDQL